MMCVHGTVPVFCLRFEVLDDGKEDITDDEEGEGSHDGRAGDPYPAVSQDFDQFNHVQLGPIAIADFCCPFQEGAIFQ